MRCPSVERSRPSAVVPACEVYSNDRILSTGSDISDRVGRSFHVVCEQSAWNPLLLSHAYQMTLAAVPCRSRAMGSAVIYIDTKNYVCRSDRSQIIVRICL